MASRKKVSRGRDSGVSIGLSLILLLVGFASGVYLSPRIEKALPEEVLARFGRERGNSVSQVEPAPQKKTVSGPETNKEEKPEEEKGKYTLQIAVFQDVESALGLADTLTTRGYNPYIQINSDSDRVLYLLRMGFWTSKGQASSFASSFKKTEEMASSVVQIE